MKKIYVIILILFNLLLNLGYIALADTVYDDGTFGGSAEVVAAPEPVSFIDSGTFGGACYIEYYTYGNWSETWIILYAPEDFAEPTSFDVAHYNDTALNLTWTKNGNATHTHIRRQKNSAPTSITEGTLVYNDTDEYYNDTGLDNGTNYHYSAWSYNSTLNSFTANYSTDDSCTSPEAPSNMFSPTDTGIDYIDLTWTVGNNATNTYIVMNETGYADYPDSVTNGTVVYNQSGSSTTVSSLTSNTTYYFTAWSILDCTEWFYSETNITYNDSTLAQADSPTNLDVITINDTRIIMNWTKGLESPYTVIRRNIGSYPSLTTGTEVYNDTGNSFTDTGLTPSSNYYYRAWGWNGESFSNTTSDDSNRTYPAPITEFVGVIGGTELTMTWDEGIGADRTVIVYNVSGYPDVIANGTTIYNDTGNITNVSGVSNISYYRAWAYALVDSVHMYSVSTDLVWGGLVIYCYDENNGSNLTFDVFITNADHSETYLQENCTNPTFIDVGDTPNGEDCTVQISAENHSTRIYIMDLYDNTYNRLDAFLPLDMPPLGEDDPNYDPANETYSHSYYLLVLDSTETGIQDALITIYRAINLSGTLDYHMVHSEYTDAAGSITVSLLPDVLYLVEIEKTGYTTIEENYEPDPDYYGIYYPKKFYLRYATVDDEIYTVGDIIDFTATMDSDGNITVSYYDTLQYTENTQIRIYEYYNGTKTLNYTNNRVDDSNFSFVSTGYNISRVHYVVVWVNHSNFSEMIKLEVTIFPIRSGTDLEDLEEKFSNVLGTWDLGWVRTFLIYFPCIIFIVILGGYGHVGLGITTSGLYLGFSTVMINFDADYAIQLVTIAMVLAMAGILMIITKKGRKNI